MTHNLFSSSGNRKAISAFILFTLIFSYVPTFMVQPVSAATTTITVPGDYASLQDAINAASPGDTISITDDISLSGGYVSICGKDGITIEGNGFTITCDPELAALCFDSAVSGITIQHINFVSVEGGACSLYVHANVTGLVVKSCSFTGLSYAILTDYDISFSGLTFTGNIISDASCESSAVIDIAADYGFTDCYIFNNTVSFNVAPSVGAGTFLYIYSSGTVSNVTVANNTIINHFEGILLDCDISGLVVSNNTFVSTMPESSDIIFRTIYVEEYDAYCDYYAFATVEITGNHFNSAQINYYAYRSSIALWDGATITDFTCSHNRFPDYAGYDTDMDGYGDTPYNLTADGSYQDSEPIAIRYMLSADPFTIISFEKLYSGAWSDIFGVLTLTGCGNFTIAAASGLPSGDFFITVNGSTWDQWSWNGSVIWILNVPCPNAEIVVDFHLEGERSNPGGSGGGGGGSGGTGGGSTPPEDNNGTSPPANNTAPIIPVIPVEGFNNWANDTFTFVPEELRPAAAASAIIGLPAVMVWLFVMLVGMAAKGGGRH